MPESSDRDTPELRVGHLYPDQLNMYGDRGNIITLRQRCLWRGVTLRHTPIDLDEELRPDEFDLIFIGGGQDKEQDEVARDLREVKGAALWAAVESDMPTLAVCGGYQLLAKFYRPAEGPELEGIGILDAWTIHKGKAVARCIGNVALQWGEQTLVGFENHGGRTYLEGSAPLARVASGKGNNGKDGTEGAVEGNCIGTYLHGSLLPKNPLLADALLGRALRRRGYDAPLPPLDDSLEQQAQAAVLARLKVHA